LQLADGETIICSGRDDDNHSVKGDRYSDVKKAAGALMESTPIGERIIHINFMHQWKM
jgi:hypothetical protein